MLSALFAVSAAVKAEVKSGDVNGSITWSYDTGTCVLTLSGTGAMPNFSSVAETPWSSEVLTTFNYGNIVINVTITDCVQTVVISDDITSIGNYAFANARSLTTLQILSPVTKVGKNAFNSCSNLATLEWNDINANLFVDPTAFEATQLLENGVLYIGTQLVFADVNIGNVSIRDNTTKINANAFKDCNKITTITIPSTVTSIGDNAFANCTSLNNVVFAENAKNVKTWGSNIFSGCTGTVDEDGFNILGGSILYSIEDKAKKKFTLPSGIAYIADGAFDGCGSGKYLDMTEYSTPPAVAKGATSGILSDLTTIVNGGDESNYKDVSVWGNKVNKTLNLLVKADKYTSCTFLHPVTIPTGVAVYKAVITSGDNVKLVKLNEENKSTIIPAGVGVLLRTNDEGKFDFINPGIEVGDKSRLSDNALIGVTDDITLNSSDNACVLQTVNGTQAFYKVGSKSITVKMGKCYLSLEGASQAATVSFFSIDDETSGIEDVQQIEGAKKTQIYNMAGQKMSSPQKGINIINGKKVYIK